MANSSGPPDNKHDAEHNHGQHHDCDDSARALALLLPFVCALEGLGCLLDEVLALDDVEVDAVQQRALHDHQVVQLFVHIVEFVDGLHDLQYLLIAFLLHP